MPHTQLTTLGLRNVFEDINAYGTEASVEELIERNPNVLMIVHSFTDEADQTPEGIKARLRSLPGAGDMQAIVNDRIIGVPSTQGGPEQSAVDGLELLGQQLATLK